MSKITLEEWKKCINKTEKVENKDSETKEHWLWSKKSEKRYIEVLNKLGRWRRK